MIQISSRQKVYPSKKSAEKEKRRYEAFKAEIRIAEGKRREFIKDLLHLISVFFISVVALAILATLVFGTYYLLEGESLMVVQFFGVVVGSMLGSVAGYFLWKFISPYNQQ